MPFEDNEKINVLYKKNVFVTSTNPDKPWYLENSVPFNEYFFSTDILTQDIPNTFVQSSNAVAKDGLDVDDIFDNVQGTVRKYNKLKLQEVPGSNKTAYYYLHNGINILKDAIPFNYKQTS